MDSASWQLMLEGLQATALLALTSSLLSLLIGTVVGILRVAPFAPTRSFATGYTEFFRNIPLLTVLFFVYIGLPAAGLTLPTFQAAMWGLAIYTSAYVAETVRAGLQSISHGQIEAARSLGLSYLQMLRFVLLPQAFRIIIPPLGTLFIALTKNTSVASVIAFPDIMYNAAVVEGRTFNPNSFLLAGLLYLVVTVPMSGLVNVMERRLALPR